MKGIFLGLLISMLSMQLHAAVPISIELKTATRVDGAVYRLSDVAFIRTEDRAAHSILNEIVIGRSPKVGQIGYVSRIDLEAKVRTAQPSWAETIHWTGASIAKVRTNGRELAREDVIAAADSTLRQWLEAQHGTATMELRTDLAPIYVPNGHAEVRARVAENARIASHLCIWVDVLVVGKHYQSVPLWYDVSAIRPVYRVTNDLPPGHVVTENDFEATEVDVAAVRGKTWPVTEVLENQRTTKWIAASAILTDDMLEAVPDVVKGERVIVTAASGPVALQVSAVALKDGNVDDRIMVTREQRLDKFQVLVTGKGQAVVADATHNEN